VLDEHTGEVTCDVCGRLIGNYLDERYYELITTKYCPDCRKLVRGNQLREAQRAWRRRRKKERKEQAKTIEELTRMTAALIEKTKLIEEENERLKAELRR
jgi:hypothetical protein